MKARLAGSGVRYFLSSAGTWALDLGVFLLLYRSMPPALALLVSRLVAMTFGFTAQKYFSFRARSKPSTRELVGYVALATLNFIITATVLSAFPTADHGFIALLKLSLELALFVANYFLLRLLFTGRRG